MKKIVLNIALILATGFASTSCFDLTEETFNQIDSSLYYNNEEDLKGAIAGVYGNAALAFA